MTRPGTTAELIRTLDEKYVANSIAFEAMMATGAFILDGTGMRRSDGSIDLDAIRARIEAATWRMPAMRQRLVPTPLRLTTPAWVPVAELDITHHVTLHPTVERDDPNDVEVLTGRSNGSMDPDRPLWDFRIVGLDSGRIVLVFRFHHVLGDALFGFRVGEFISGDEPSTDLPAPTPEERAAIGVAPRTGVGILAIAGRKWLREQRGIRGAWHEYWRKPYARRLRRWGGRILRPVKNAAIARGGEAARILVPRHSRYLELDLAAATRHARALRGSVHDLTVAATLRAAAQLDGSRETVSLLVPIAGRRRGDGDVRNHISVAKVTVAAGDPIERIVPAVREQVHAALAAGTRRDLGARDWVGYATYVPWRRRPRYLGEARVVGLTAWPAGDPLDDVACLASSYAGTLTISVTTRATTDIDAIMASIGESFAASDAVVVAVAAG